ncbi:MAG: hypothetical protein HKN54_07275, partial [Flavobacteriaceae bacterium]|nr:hypothetical protein [Flavobacteriaceae bacterium]
KILISQHYGSRKTAYGICYGFFENRWTGRRTLDHSGGQLGFVSLMVLIPETGDGIFIAQNNRKDAGGFRYDLTRAILDTLVGRKNNGFDSVAKPKSIEDIAKNYTGVYKQMNYPKNSFEKLIRLFGFFSTEYKIEYDGQGSLTTYGDSYVPAGDHLFRLNQSDTDYFLEFFPDESGKAQRMMNGTGSYERISWFEKNRVQQGFFIPSIFLLLIFVLSRPIGRLKRKRREKRYAPKPANKRFNKWMYVTALLVVLGALGLILHFLILRDQVSDYGVPLSMKFNFLVCTAGFISAILSPYFLWRNWSLKGLGIIKKMMNSVIIIAIILVAIMFYEYNLIGFQYY